MASSEAHETLRSAQEDALEWLQAGATSVVCFLEQKPAPKAA